MTRAASMSLTRAVSVKSGLGQDCENPLGQPAVRQLVRRDVDGELQVGRPIPGFEAGLPPHGVAQLGDQTAILRQLDELHRRDQAARRMVPTRQNFKSQQFTIAQGHERLKEGLDLPARHRGPQFLLHLRPRLELAVHGGLEETERSRPSFLPRYMATSAACRRASASAPSRGDTAMPTVAPTSTWVSPQGVGRARPATMVSPSRTRSSLPSRYRTRSANSSPRAARPRPPRDEAAESLRGRAQHRVSGRVPVQIVHGLEPVEVDHHDRVRVVRFCCPQSLFDPLLQQPAVRQAGQTVVAGELVCVRFGPDARLHLTPQLERLVNAGRKDAEAHAEAEHDEVRQAVAGHYVSGDLEQSQALPCDPDTLRGQEEAERVVEFALPP